MGLVAGPRGRRLFYEIAAAQSEDVHAIMFDLAWMFDRHDSGTIRFGVDDEVPQSKATVAQLVDALAEIDLDLIQPHDVMTAFQASVDSARLYQNPDGIDRVLQAKAVRKQLKRIRKRVTSFEEFAWWYEPMSGEQWEAVYKPDELAGVEDVPLARALEISPSGQWWTNPGPLVTSRLYGDAPVHAYLHEDRFGDDLEGHLITPLEPVLEITVESWVHLCQRYPFNCGRGVWDEATGAKGSWVMPDWPKVAADYAGVHLSAAAYLEFSGVPIAVDNKLSVIAGWAPDATYWLREVERGPRRIWRHLAL